MDSQLSHSPARGAPEDRVTRSLRTCSPFTHKAGASGQEYAGLVDGWEMVGEADIGYCRDLPERTVAFQKALYLGIKAGAEEAGQPEAVAMGALGLPPGPWVDRAVRNGLLDYTDAYNFHYYGRAEDLAGVIEAHRAIAGPSLPIWITECGVKTVSPDDFLNPERRRLQAEFIVATGTEARRQNVALFMPFILTDRGDPYALTLSADKPLPAWTSYAALTRKLDWPRVPWARRTRGAFTRCHAMAAGCRLGRAAQGVRHLSFPWRIRHSG